VAVKVSAATIVHLFNICKMILPAQVFVQPGAERQVNYFPTKLQGKSLCKLSREDWQRQMADHRAGGLS